MNRSNERTGREPLLAAADLGSNSFHMVVARYTHGQLVIVDRLRESIRLAAGVEASGRIDKEVAARAIACLERFGQRLRDMRAGSVRVVGTNALRQAGCKRAFLERAREALGHPIEIISGREEARLIYCGVAHTTPGEPKQRLVIDIGGGSTEMIVGLGKTPLEVESVQAGSVSISERFFPKGIISAKQLGRARIAARLELEPVREAFKRRGWDEAVGSSGAIRAITEVLRELDPQATTIKAKDIELLLEQLIDAGSTAALPFSSLGEDRRSLFPAGVAILAELFDVLGIKEMRIAGGALREGLLYDMVGRFSNEDARDRTVRAMQKRYHVDLAQAERVEATAIELLRAARGNWGLEDALIDSTMRWAARLHEIGLDVSHSGYQRHGAYLLENADMPGFAREEQRVLARLVGGHRRKLSLNELEDLMPPWDRRGVYLVVLLRLAVLLHRGRSPSALPRIELSCSPRTLRIRLPRRWLDEHPLTRADLQQEIAYLKAAGFRLRVFSGRFNAVT